ncbi:MAG: hypothetical protein NTY73_02805 [Candidatus Micrarchaeota archaeon]|nr:hypothetical protein [Candidatus Micrarchaeota archaeon]
MVETEVIEYSIEAFRKNAKLVLFFSVPFLLAFAIPLLSPMPTYVSMGATFLRTGSMFVDLTYFDIGLIFVSSLASLFLVSFAIVSINLVIKSQRTMTNIRMEVIEGIEKYTMTIFLLYSIALVLSLVVLLVSYEYQVEGLTTPLFSFLISLVLFYVPAAIVIDELRLTEAMRMSLYMIKNKFMLFLLWLVLGFVILTVLDAGSVFLASLHFTWSRYVMLVLNSLIVLPFLVILQTQMYLTKYTILK